MPSFIALAHLLILVGQSNAYGFEVQSADVPARYTVTEQVQIYNRQTGAFETLVPGVNTNNRSTNWGPEVEYAYLFHKDHPTETLYVFKNVEGGSGLAKDGVTPDWSPQSKGDIFDKATSRLMQAKADISKRGEDVTCTRIAVMQGETDATSASASAAYSTNLKDFVAHARGAWGKSDTLVLIGRINAPKLPFRNAVRLAQSALAKRDGRAVLVDTDGLALQPDQLHLNAVGEIGLGAALYAAARDAELKTGDSTGCPGASRQHP
ncbi:hypothetical protein BH10PSE5_BH10PSE5_05100 [soil metagenome]